MKERKIEAISDLERERKALPISLCPPVYSFYFLLLNVILPEKKGFSIQNSSIYPYLTYSLQKQWKERQ
jgi:hypothetical protein